MAASQQDRLARLGHGIASTGIGHDWRIGIFGKGGQSGASSMVELKASSHVIFFPVSQAMRPMIALMQDLAPHSVSL